jgi:hypothetical protein
VVRPAGGACSEVVPLKLIPHIVEPSAALPEATTRDGFACERLMMLCDARCMAAREAFGVEMEGEDFAIMCQTSVCIAACSSALGRWLGASSKPVELMCWARSTRYGTAGHVWTILKQESVNRDDVHVDLVASSKRRRRWNGGGRPLSGWRCDRRRGGWKDRTGSRSLRQLGRSAIWQREEGGERSA